MVWVRVDILRAELQKQIYLVKSKKNKEKSNLSKHVPPSNSELEGSLLLNHWRNELEGVFKNIGWMSWRECSKRLEGWVGGSAQKHWRDELEGTKKNVKSVGGGYMLKILNSCQNISLQLNFPSNSFFFCKFKEKQFQDFCRVFSCTSPLVIQRWQENWIEIIESRQVNYTCTILQ